MVKHLGMLLFLWIWDAKLAWKMEPRSIQKASKWLQCQNRTFGSVAILGAQIPWEGVESKILR